MKMRNMRFGLLAAVVATVAVAPLSAEGQGARRVEFELSGGGTALTSESAELHTGGAHAQAALLFATPIRLIDQFRVDGSYHSLPGKAFPTLIVPDAGLVVLSASAIKHVLPFASVRPYVLAGVGTYNMDQGGGRESHFGVNGGVGLRFPMGPVGGFLESRFHHVFTGKPNDFIPVSFGVAF
jgi:hypothetical protein